MNTVSRHRHRLARRLSWLVIAGLTTAALFAPAGLVRAAAVTPIHIPGADNVSCAELDGIYGGDQTWLEFKLQDAQLADGTYTQGDLSVTISNFEQDGDTGSFDFTSNFGVDAVLVKTGVAGKNLYVYADDSADPESFGDTNLQTPSGSGNGFSHISFCYDTSNPTPSSAPPSSAPPSTAPPSTAPPSTAPPSTAPPSTAPPSTAPPSTAPPSGGVLPTQSTAPTSTPTGDVGGATGTPGTTLPPTDTLGDAGAAPGSDAWRLVLLALAGTLATALLLTPARAVRKDR